MTTIYLAKTDYTLAAGASLTFTNETAFVIQAIDTNDNPWLTIAGDLRVVTVQSPPFSPGYVNAVSVGYSSFYGASRIHVTTTGKMLVDTTATSDVAHGVQAGSWTPRIINDGLIEVKARSAAFGLTNWGAFDDSAPAVLNNGTLRVTSLGEARGVGMSAGEWLQNAGLIDVYGADRAVGVAFAQSRSTFRNLGEIRVRDDNPDQDSIGVLFRSNVQGFFYNAGLIEAEVALKVESLFGPYEGSDVFQNGGRMVGRIELGPGNQALLNSGVITGNVNLGVGNDVYNGREGSVSGLVSGGDGADAMVGGVGFDYLHGNVGDDTASGGLGGDWVVGGQGNDALYGEQDHDVVYGNLGNDTQYGDDGNDWVRGGQGSDSISAGSGDDFVAGDRGADTISGGSGADTFHAFSGIGLDRITDFSAAEGDRVNLLAGTSYTLSQSGADTVVDLGGGDQIVLVGVQLSTLPAGWIFVG